MLFKTVYKHTKYTAKIFTKMVIVYDKNSNFGLKAL